MERVTLTSNAEADALDAELFRALEDDPSPVRAFPAEVYQDTEAGSSRKRPRLAASSDEASQTPAQAAASPVSRTGVFAVLPDEVAMQVLACTSAADLAAIAQTSRFFRKAAAENELWRPLFLARWGNKQEDSEKLQDSLSWKEKYMERDSQDVAEVRSRVPSFIRELYLQMSTAKRMLALPRRRAVAPPSDAALKGRISRWRTVRGLTRCPAPQLGSEHRHCGQKGPFAALRGGLFMCEACGWAHLCDENCSERFCDSRAELLVCPVSGRCFDIITEDNYDDARDGQEEGGAYDFGTAGHWGRAYADGYDCASEEELRRNCGACV